jgi:hypothetical protein
MAYTPNAYVPKESLKYGSYVPNNYSAGQQPVTQYQQQPYAQKQKYEADRLEAIKQLEQQKAQIAKAAYTGYTPMEEAARQMAGIDAQIENLKSSDKLDWGAVGQAAMGATDALLSPIANDPNAAYGLNRLVNGPAEHPNANVNRQNQADLAKHAAKTQEAERRAEGEAKRNVGAMAGEWTETAANQAANLAAEAAGGEAGAGTAIARMQAAQQARNQVGAENIQKAQERKDKYESQMLERAEKTSNAQEAQAAAAAEGNAAQQKFADEQKKNWIGDYAQQRQGDTGPTAGEMNKTDPVQQAQTAVNHATNISNNINMTQPEQAQLNTSQTRNENAQQASEQTPFQENASHQMQPSLDLDPPVPDQSKTVTEQPKTVTEQPKTSEGTGSSTSDKKAPLTRAQQSAIDKQAALDAKTALNAGILANKNDTDLQDNWKAYLADWDTRLRRTPYQKDKDALQREKNKYLLAQQQDPAAFKEMVNAWDKAARGIVEEAPAQ